jgi:predicted unusual protein kinase regulating ubiquinone biosynthesis (AarF/ABC1/UbiB family)
MNTNLPLELDFTKEAQNIEKCRQLMKPMIRSGELALPEVYDSTPRVLVMSFEEGCYLTNSAKMSEMELNKGEVARLISKTFCEQMYQTHLISPYIPLSPLTVLSVFSPL